MPSTARQRLPAELWPHNRDALCSQVFTSSHEMQACPGQCDDLKQQRKSPSQKMHQFERTQRKHRTGQKSSKPAFAGGISDTLDDLVLSERTFRDNSSFSSVDFSLLSSTSDSDSNVDYTSKKDAFAMDAESSAPPPCQVPLPPMEWLKPTSKSPLTVGRSLQALMHCESST